MVNLSEVNSREYNVEEYGKICLEEIERDVGQLEYVDYKGLPTEKEREIYALLCKRAILKDEGAINFLKYSYLPEQMQEILKQEYNNIRYKHYEKLSFIKKDFLKEEILNSKLNNLNNTNSIDSYTKLVLEEYYNKSNIPQNYSSEILENEREELIKMEYDKFLKNTLLNYSPSLDKGLGM